MDKKALTKTEWFGGMLFAALLIYFSYNIILGICNLSYTGMDVGIMELREYQKEAVNFILEKRRCLIALDMGTGKSAVALMAADRTNSYPCVIVCPSYIKPNWKDQIEKWVPERSFQILDSKSDIENGKDIYVLNYDILDKFVDRFRRLKVKCVVLDESHFVKNKKAQRTKLVKSLCNPVDMVIPMTGTPIESRPSELVSQLNILSRIKEFGGEWMFKKRYCVSDHHTGTVECPHEICRVKDRRYSSKPCSPCVGWMMCYCGHTKWGYWNFNGASNLIELNTKLREVCMFRKTKEEVKLDLPIFDRQIVYLKSNNSKAYDAASHDFITWVMDNKGVEAAQRAYRAEAIVRMETLKKLAVEGKLASAIEWINDFLESGKKLVVFTWHTDTLITVTLSVAASHPGMMVAAISGSDTPDARKRIIDMFNESPSTALLVANIKAGGLGIDLTAASGCVFLELAWTPTAHDQAESRLHRFGQDESVTAWYLLSENTIERTIYRILQAKRRVISSAIDGATDAKDFDIEMEVANELTLFPKEGGARERGDVKGDHGGTEGQASAAQD